MEIRVSYGIVAAIVLVVGASSIHLTAQDKQADSSAALTPAQIEAAIAYGQSGRARPYELKASPGQLGIAYTPLIRVALAAREAKREYRNFSATDVPSDWLEPSILIRVWSFPACEKNGPPQPLSVIAMPKKGKDPNQVIRPAWIKTEMDQKQNWFGAKWEERGIWAQFPISVVSQENEFVVVYDQDHWNCFGKAEQRFSMRCRFGTEGCVPIDSKDPASTIK